LAGLPRSGWRKMMFQMTPRQLAVIERAKRTPVRIVEIPPRRGVRAGDAMRKLREEDARCISALLEAELMHVEAWSNIA
jgi:hypothetical protein